MTRPTEQVLNEREALVKENVALREALGWMAARHEVAGHQNNDLLQRRLIGTSDPETMAFLNGVIAVRALLADPSPAVAEIMARPTAEQVQAARDRLQERARDVQTLLAELDAVTAERDQAIRELGVLGQQLGREQHAAHMQSLGLDLETQRRK